MDDNEPFDYERSARYTMRCITKASESLKKLIAAAYSIENVTQVKVYITELTTEYESFKRIASRGFVAAAEADKDEDVKKIEDNIMKDLDNVKGITLPMLAKANVYVNEFEAQNIRESMSNASMNASFGNNATEPAVKLPKINLPKFDGRIENFLEFYSLFSNLVQEEPTISKVRKLYYLKDSLIGDAATLVRDTPLTDRGYDEAWCLVQATYKDIKSITRKHFDQLFSISRIKSSNEIAGLLASVNRSLKGLKACGEDSDNWGPILSYLVSEKLDETTYNEFEKSLQTNTKFPAWKTLKSFLENRASITKRSSDVKSNRTTVTPNPSNKRTSLATADVEAGRSASTSTAYQSKSRSNEAPKPKCACCDKLHFLIDCESFKNKSPKERYEFIKSKSMCGNCFYANHKTSDCKKSPNCKKCKKSHHSLLHFDDKENESNSSGESKPKGKPATCGVSVETSYASTNESALLSVRKPVPLLPSALVKFRCGTKSGTMRVLLDSCSQLNLISSEFAKRNNLQLIKVPNASNVVGIGNSETQCDQVVKLTIQSRIEEFEYCAHFNVINHIPYSVNNLFVDDFSAKVHEHELNLADTAFYDRYVNISVIDAVLGIEAYDKCVRGQTIKVQSAYLRNTTFGWTVSSIIEPVNRNRKSLNSESYCGLTSEKIDERLERFWKIEDIPNDSTRNEHDACKEHFMKTYKRNPDGSFTVRIPFKEEPSLITGNFGIALKYLNRIEGKLDEKTKEMHSDFMEEYKSLNHMSIISDDTPRYFIPHHAVLRPSSTTTKLRVVFHASAKSYCGKSLNDVLMVGPTIQPELFDTSLRFRTKRHGIVADIAMMYRCIWVAEEDRRFQLIIWRDKNYELNTITYGIGPAAFIATACLEVLADEVKGTEPLTSESILEGFYMDDWLSGADTIEEAIELQQSVHKMLSSGCFKLRKYQSNTKEILNRIDPLLIERNLTIQFGENESLSVLGLFWCPEKDTFMLKSDILEPKSGVTKRQMLSTISKVFDPLGLASPVTIRGKLMFQSLWKLGLAWDEIVPVEIENRFRSYLSDLHGLTKFEIPRYILNFNWKTETIIGFCDASEQAYCAVVYALDSCTEPNRLQLLCSKTRVAPVKPLKIPELELQAAVLLVQLVSRVCKILKIDASSAQLFTDSTIVLAWLSRPLRDWKTFVRNRVAKVVAEFPIKHWSHVRSGENPADLATRGFSTKSLIESPIWLNGPEFVMNRNTLQSTAEIDDSICKSYLVKPKRVSLIVTEVENDMKIINSMSSYEELRSIYATVAACFRRWKSLVLKRECIPVKIQANDVIVATKWLTRIVQIDAFTEEINRIKLEPNKSLKKRSILRLHTPFIDEEGILRLRTRLQNARRPYNEKSPIILPSNHPYTKLYVRYLHEKFYHAGRAWLLTNLSPNYVFIGGIGRIIKSIIHNCRECIERFVQTKPQQMADLPADRVSPSPPFQVVGIDFTGAFHLKCSYHRSTKYMKAYACIFVCFSTRAVHIELVPSLSTEDFLNALKCFVARRGVPSTIYSDNGTNFKGGERYLNFETSEIQNYSNRNTITWKFNPPYTPHRGGIWESAVKSAKRFIPKVTDDQKFDENELRTLLTQIEGILNSRPLAYTQTSGPVEEVLTPGHFLIGRNLSVLPESTEPPKNIKLSSQYEANRNRIRDFWHIWSQDYLNQLRSRTKWTDERPNLEVGQVVLLRKVHSEPSRWPLAKITKTFPDKSNLVHTVEVLSMNRSQVVPITHVVPLPVN